MLKKSFWLVLLMSLMGTVVSLAAQELPQSAASPLITAGPDISLGGPYTPYQTFAKYSNSIKFVGAGDQPLDTGATTITCPGPGSCLIEIDDFVQIGSNAADNLWSICAKVDGVYVDTPYGPYQGYTHIAGQYLYSVGSFVQFAVVSPGTHTVQTFIYSQDGLTESIWSISYKVSTS